MYPFGSGKLSNNVLTKAQLAGIGTPTVFPQKSEDFNAISDAVALMKNLKNTKGVNEEDLIKIICFRSNQQRQEIAKAFNTHYLKDLISEIKSATKDNIQDLLVACMTPTVEFYCKELHRALNPPKTDDNVLIEALCTLNNYEIDMLKKNYLKMYETPLEQNLEEGSGNFKRLLATLCNVNRDESGYTDIISARADATELFLAGKAKFNTDESTFNRIVCQRNYEQLKVIFQEYRNIAGHSLERAIKKECSADVEIGLKAILRCIDSKAEFFALQLNKNISALGGDDSQVIRILINRCEIDLEEIKESYERMFGKSLESLIEGEIPECYKNALLVLLGEYQSKN